jgi:hypothetical protein
MKFLAIYLAASFVLSAGLSFFSGRLWWGVLVPFCCLILYLIVVGGLRVEAIGFAIAILAIYAIPIGLISWLGAMTGIALSVRLKIKQSSDSALQDR